MVFNRSRLSSKLRETLVFSGQIARSPDVALRCAGQPAAVGGVHHSPLLAARHRELASLARPPQ